MTRATPVVNRPLTPDEDRDLIRQMRTTAAVSRALRPQLVERSQVSQPTKE